MYRFAVTTELPAPVQSTFAQATRDFDAFVRDVPQLTRLQTLSREHLDDACERVVLRMQAGVRLPGFAGALLRPEWLGWEEILICSKQPPHIDWTVVADAFTHDIHCEGTTDFVPSAVGTRICSHGSFSLSMSRIPGVPRGMVRIVDRLLENLLGRMIVPNVRAYFEAIRRRLAEPPSADPPPRHQVTPKGGCRAI